MDYPIIYVENESTLDSAVETLEKCDVIYIDLEFDKNHFRYGFNLCLMQIFDGKTCFLIDPLKDISIEKIFPVLEDSGIEKVCFAFGEDIRLLHHIGCLPKNVLDLAVVRTLLGKSTLSLSNTLVEELGMEAQKSQQKSNWFDRPLKEEQIIYAAEDVIYLPELRDALMKEVEEMSRHSWVEQEKKQLEEEDWTRNDSTEVVPFKDRKLLNMRQWIRYGALMEFRDEVAKNMNRPSYKVIDKAAFFDMAKTPDEVNNWLSRKGVHPKLRNEKIRDKIKTILKEAQKTIEQNKIGENQSSRPPLSNEERLRHSQLRTKLSREKDTVFTPIKEELVKDYGENFANFLLSNRRINQIVEGKISLLPYQKQLLLHYSTSLKIPTPDYFLTSEDQGF